MRTTRTVLVLLHRARVQRGERVLVRIVGRVELEVGPSAKLAVGAAHEALEARLGQRPRAFGRLERAEIDVDVREDREGVLGHPRRLGLEREEPLLLLGEDVGLHPQEPAEEDLVLGEGRVARQVETKVSGRAWISGTNQAEAAPALVAAAM